MLKIQGQPRVWMGDEIAVKAGVDTSTTGAIVSATAASPCVVTDTGHGLSDGDVITFGTLNELVELSDREFIISSAATNSFELLDESGDLVSTLGLTAETTAGGTWTLMETDEGTVTLNMDGQEILLENLTVLWNTVAVGDYLIAPVTVDAKTGEVGSDGTTTMEWEVVPAATFAKYFVVQGG